MADRATRRGAVDGLTPGETGPRVGLLHEHLAAIGADVEPEERRAATFGDSTREAIRRFQERTALLPTGELDDDTVEAIAKARAQHTYVVTGRVSSPTSPAVGGLHVEVVDRNVGRDVTLAKAVTDDRGRYRVEFTAERLHERGKTRPDLQARVDAGGVTASSAVHYDATNYEQLDVVLAADAQLASEHEALVTALSAHVDRLADLREDDERGDVTYLANKAGWDARAVAMAALAERFSAGDGDERGPKGITPELYYALFRAGVPANASALFRLPATTVESVWRDAIAQGVIARSSEELLPGAIEAFKRASASTALDAVVAPGASSTRDLLDLSLPGDREAHERFARLATDHHGDARVLWKKAEGELGTEAVERLRVTGQLGYLTLDNAPLIARLHEVNGEPLTSTRQLVDHGLHEADAWEQILDDAHVPEAVPGDTAAERRAGYAAALATQVRVSFPTAVVSKMVAAGDLLVDIDDDVRAGVTAFLDEHDGAFEIDLDPIEGYLAHNGIDGVSSEVVTEVKRIQRVRQITPTDEASAVLLREGVDAAFKVLAYRPQEFEDAFAHALGGPEVAAKTYAKASQVHSAVVNIAATYLTARSAPTMGSAAGAFVIDPTFRNAQADGGGDGGAGGGGGAGGDVIAYPTLEQLMGSMDYCACEHCRSFLSPAAYLVDLLLFLDRNVGGVVNPQSVLLERRPDIEWLPLTCENTNTPLPYIDLVNETLEYFVTTTDAQHHHTLAAYQGHDTDERVTPAELLADPQYVNDAAYAALLAETFPPPLPFHRPLEAARLHLQAFGTELAEVMELLRADEDVDRADDASYAWRDILMERVRLSREEHALLTDREVGLHELYGFDGATSEDDMRAELTNFKRYARRAGVSYEELVAVLQTRLVNPDAVLLPRIERLGVPFVVLKQLKDGTISDDDFDALLRPGLDEAEYDGDIKAWVRDDAVYARIMGLITVTTPADGDPCSVDLLELHYADPDAAGEPIAASDFVAMARFIRLWRKLGWPMHAVDEALAALWPPAQWPIGHDDESANRLADGFLAVIPRLGIASTVAQHLKLQPKKHVTELTVCWGPMGTFGDSSLYSRLFQTHATLAHDEAFADDGYGNVLDAPDAHLLDHADAVRAACNLTTAELQAVFDALGYDDTTLLRIDTVSAVYRHAWLARKLKLSVVELIALIGATGFDPFAMPDPPAPGILALIRLVEDVREAGLKPAEALRLVWGVNVIGATAVGEEVRPFLRELRTSLAAVESELAIVDDPTGEVAQARMAVVYGAETTAFLFSLLDQTLRITAPYANDDATLDDDVVAASGGRLSYDDFAKQLVFAGALSAAMRDAIKAVPAASAELDAAVDALFAASEAQTAPFFARYPELLTLFDAYSASADPPVVKRATLLGTILPALVQRRKAQQAVLITANAAGADATFGAAVLEDAAALHAAGDPARPAIDDLVAGDLAGASATFYFRDTATGNVDATDDAVETIDYAPGGARELPANPTAGDPVSAVWHAFLEAPQSGNVNLAVDTDAGATVAISIDGEAVALAQDGSSWHNDVAITLDAGRLYELHVTVENVTGGVTLRWESPGLGWEVVPGSALYPAVATGRIEAAFVRFASAATLATKLRIDADELAHLATDADLAVGGEGWLNALATEGALDQATAHALTTPLRGALQLAALKKAATGGSERVLEVLADPTAAASEDASLLSVVMGWEDDSVAALVERFGLTTADLSHLGNLARVAEAYTAVRASGTGAADLVAVTTNTPTGDTVRAFRAALRARYDEAAWLEVLRPINDKLRSRQRDALVAFVLRRLAENPDTSHIDTIEKLFEFFLMDVGMEPCMQTSRIRHALSSVQLFIERCLMNLEPRVSPSLLDAAQWQWMKRYRVWEANRKVFLWPENWLEPELRDDQSPFFKEVMGELLQGDITEDAAATAMGNYLAKLEDVARLDVCGVHLVEGDPGSSDDVAHVIAHTAGAKRNWYYRRREYGYWTPWQQVKLDIEDEPAVPVVWRGRLFLMWLRLVQEAPLEAKVPGPAPTTPLTDLQRSDVESLDAKVWVKVILCWSEYHNGEWQPAKTSNVDNPAPLMQLHPDDVDRSLLQLWFSETSEGLRIDVSGLGSTSFLMYNTHSSPEVGFSVFGIWDIVWVGGRTRELSTSGAGDESAGDELIATYDSGLLVPLGANVNATLKRRILETPYRDRVVEPHHDLDNTWDAPFFYLDGHHAFYVTTTEQTVKLPYFGGFGAVDVAPAPKLNIPPIVLEREQVIPDLLGPVIRGYDPTVYDPVPMQRFVTQDAYVHRAIATSGAVRFGTKELGPAGAVDRARVER